jgi:hypothetical protein
MSSPDPLLLLALALVLPVVMTAGWGPGTHLEFAHRVWRRRKETLPRATAELLGQEKRAYFYGNLAADIINFKAWGGHYNHCHRWTIVDEMREVGSSAREEAFVLGYLSHLAADTIAHNHFVPYHLVRYARTRGLGHLYWEMSADRFVPESLWDVVADLEQDRTLDGLDELINAAVSKKALSMRTNKLIFNHVLLVSKGERWRRNVARIHPLRRVNLTKGFLELFRRAAVARVQLALEPKGLARLSHVDTNGKEAQKSAVQARKALLRSTLPGARRRADAEELAVAYLDGMQTPPKGARVPHWE